MKKICIVNGWREGRSYFFRLGNFTKEEFAKLENGETITKGGNEFRIEKKED